MKYIYVCSIGNYQTDMQTDLVRFESIFVDATSESDAYDYGQRYTFPRLAITEYLQNDYVTLIPESYHNCKPRKNVPWPGDWVKWNGQIGQVIGASSVSRTVSVIVGAVSYHGVSVDEFDEIRSAPVRPEQV